MQQLSQIPKFPYDPCSCVSYAKAQTWQKESWGYPNLLKPSSQEPIEGSVILTSEGDYGHAGVVTSFTQTTVTISEANYVRCKVGTRTLERSDKKIRGYLTIKYK